MIVLEFTPEQMAVLNDALGGLPYRDAAPLIAAINQQIQKQMTPSPPASGSD